MAIPLLGFLSSSLGRKVGLGIAAVLVLYAGLKYWEGRVRQDEQLKQADKYTQEVEKMREADRAATEKILQDAQARQEAAEARMQASLDREAGLVRSLAAISQQRSVLAGEVSRVTDSDLHRFNIEQMGRRIASDSTPCYLPAEERTIATALTQYPLCQKQVAAQEEQIKEVKVQLDAQNDKIAAIETKLDAVTGYATRLEGYYVTIFNSFPRKRRSIKCAFLWSCGKAKPLPVPTPIDLKKSLTP